jgi:hypothetical protein
VDIVGGSDGLVSVADLKIAGVASRRTGGTEPA